MNVNVKLTITDEERDILADYLDGKASKRLATRKDVNSFVQGCIAAATDGAATPEAEAATASDLPEWAYREADRLAAEGHDPSYIRGWLKVKLKRRRA